jgi:glycosyltransferase involved in cell wall biosynthesis
MLVSFIVVAYNAAQTLNSLLTDLKKQDYDHKKIEVILIDGNSDDDTKRVMTEFAVSSSDFFRVCVLDNPKRILPSGWNIALKESRGDIILRVDAHSSISEDFVRKNVECIKSGDKICGGPRISIITEDTSWQRTLLLVESSVFGSGIAEYRRNKGKRHVKTLAHAAYSREVFQTVGPYNELLVRTEDNEMHHRMRRAGYKFCFDPSIVSYHHARNSLPKMLKQKYLNGYWIGRSLRICPKAFSCYHFAPVCWLVAIIMTTLLVFRGISFPAKVVWLTYCAGALVMTLSLILRGKINWYFMLLPFLFFLVHISYGVGTIIGTIRGLVSKANNSQ